MKLVGAVSLVLFAASTTPARAGLELIFDTSAAHATLDVLTGASPATPEELARVAALPANQAQIRHAARFRASYTAQSFVDDLGKAARNEPLGDDPWELGLVKERLAATKELLQKVETAPKALTDAVASRLAAFVEPGKSARIVVHFIVGGSSDGFAPEASDFYIALHFFRGDEEGLRVLMSHELFHIIRPKPKAVTPEPPRNVAAARELIDHTMNEGVASWIGDPTRAPAGPYVDWFALKYKRNLNRLSENVALFDVLLYYIWNDAEADENGLYKLGFSGVWDSPLYFVGYAMAGYLAAKEGPGAVPDAVRAGAEAFFARYRAAAKKHGGAPVTFSKSTEKILTSLGSR